MEILIPILTTSLEHPFQLNTMRQKLLSTFSKPNAKRNRALIESSLLWPLEIFGDVVSEGPQKLQEATASSTHLRAFVRKTAHVFEGSS